MTKTDQSNKHKTFNHKNIYPTKADQAKKQNMFNQKNTSPLKTYFGFIIYFIVFIMCVPYLLYKYSYFHVLTGYMPNVDLVANILTWHGGPDNIWANLYNPHNRPSPTLSSYICKTLINYIALLGLTFLIAQEATRMKSIHKGWSIGIVTILMTYLLPSDIISLLMDKLAIFLIKAHIPMNFNMMITLLFGTILTVSIILLESKIIHKYIRNLDSLAEILLKFPKKLPGYSAKWFQRGVLYI